MKINRLEPVGPSDPPRQEKWIYRCDCGNQVIKKRRDVLNGRVKSCGCLNAELRIIRNTKHGKACRGHNNQLYWVWAAMRKRCNDPNSQDFPDYGGRGIRVCKRWDDFEDFAADVGPRPAGLTLDRIDPDGDYEPSNVRWATWREQRLNQRRMKGNSLS